MMRVPAQGRCLMARFPDAPEECVSAEPAAHFTTAFVDAPDSTSRGIPKVDEALA